jgi:hypothetical protein
MASKCASSRAKEDGAADDEVEGIGGVGDRVEGFDAEVVGREVRGEGGGESAGLDDSFGILVGGEDLVALTKEIDEIASGAASGIEDSHAGHDVAAQDLVEEVDVDLAELLLEGGHSFKRMIQDGRRSFLMEDSKGIPRICMDDTDLEEARSWRRGGEYLPGKSSSHG